jgi:hypothetical protein
VTSDGKSASFAATGVPRDTLLDLCPDRGSIITGHTVDELLTAICACRRESALEDRIELACMQCGREVGAGTVERAGARLLIPENVCAEAVPS